MPIHEIRTLVSKTGDYTVSTTDRFIIVDASGGNITITLPEASTCQGYEFTIKKIDSSVNTVTIDGDGAETIDDDTTQIISNQYDAITVTSDNSEWWII